MFIRTDDETLLALMTQAVEDAGRRLLARFRTIPAPTTLTTLLADIAANDHAIEARLRDILQTACPGSQWSVDEEATGALPVGEWWVCDAAEGNINHIHGRPGWGVTATLVRNGEPVLTAINVPLTDDTYTAREGRGAFLNGQPIRVSDKETLDAAIVASGQASPGEVKSIRSTMTRSVDALLDAALLVRLSVPTTLELADVASGRLDAFWQHGNVRTGLLGGALLVREAGGVVTDLSGKRWTAGSRDFLAASCLLQPAILAVLSPISEPTA